MKTKFLYITIVIFCLSIPYSQAKKTIRKETFNFLAKKNTTLSISNKFGDIKISSSNKDKIEVEVTISSNMNKIKKDYKKSLDEIEIIKKIKGNNINIYTFLPSKIKHKGIFNIDYKVNVPTYVDMKLRNSFGDIIADEMSANCEITTSFGSLVINKLLPDGDTINDPNNRLPSSREPEEESNEKLELSHSECIIGTNKHSPNTYNTSRIKLSFAKDCRIQEAQNIKLKMNHSECKIKKAKILTVQSTFSDLDVDEAEKLEINSKHDDVDVISLDDIYIKKGEFSDFAIIHLNDLIKARLNFSKLIIDEVHENFQDIDILKNFGDIDISIDKDSKYLLDIVNEHGDIDLDHFIITESSNGLRKKIIAKSFIDIDTIDNLTKIIIRSKHGDVKIDKKK